MHPLNVLLVGVGGQGVNRLARALMRLCADGGLPWQGTVSKGGAMRLGAVRAELRVGADPSRFGPRIPPGAADVILGLEAWETVRARAFAGPATRIILNNAVVPFSGAPDGDPVAVVRRWGGPLIVDRFDDNFAIGRAAVEAGWLPFDPGAFRLAFEEELHDSLA